jgi:hypothetical protein
MRYRIDSMLAVVRCNRLGGRLQSVGEQVYPSAHASASASIGAVKQKAISA